MDIPSCNDESIHLRIAQFRCSYFTPQSSPDQYIYWNLNLDYGIILFLMMVHKFWPVTLITSLVENKIRIWNVGHRWRFSCLLLIINRKRATGDLHFIFLFYSLLSLPVYLYLLATVIQQLIWQHQLDEWDLRALWIRRLLQNYIARQCITAFFLSLHT